MKRKCENCELTGTQAKSMRITRSMSGRKKLLLKPRAACTGKNLRSTRTNIMDLPPELMLQIFSHLSLRDLCQRVAPVCTKWAILARHPSLRKELSFGEDISTSNARKLLRSSPLLRRLTLWDRYDSDAILRRVRRSNRRIESIEMVGCRGSARRREVNGRILSRILKGSPRLCRLDLRGTLVTSLEFYRLLGRVDDRMKSFRILSATKEGMVCYLKTRAQVHQKRKGSLNGQIRDVEKIVTMMADGSNTTKWNLILND
jgi:hypothetical protein